MIVNTLLNILQILLLIFCSSVLIKSLVYTVKKFKVIDIEEKFILLTSNILSLGIILFLLYTVV